MTLPAALAFLAGSLGALGLPPPYGPVAALALAGTGAAAALASRHAWPRTGVLAIVLLVGGAYTALHVSASIAARWPLARDGERVLATARILTIPVAGEFGTSFDAALALDPRMGGTTLTARLRWAQPQPAPRVGEVWQLAIRLRPPRAAANPSGPDMERVWFREGIDALGTVLARSRLNRRVAIGHAPVNRLRAHIADHIAATVPDRDAAALLAALAVGVTGEMSNEQWRVFNATGTTHLVAISGLHVTLFAVLAIAVARRLWRLAAPLRARVPRESFAAALGIAAATGYALLAGFSVPTQRTLVMLAAWLLARQAARASGPLHAFGIAIVVVIVLDPLAALASGFWLSFGAVGAIILAAGARIGRAGGAYQAVRVQLAVSIALVPVTLAAFGGLSLAGFAVNALAIPVFTLLLVPLVLASTAALGVAPTLADAGFAAGGWLHAQLWPALESAAAWPHALVMLAVPAWAWLIVVPAVGIAILPWPPLLRATALAGVVPLAWGSMPLASTQVEIVVFDVGRGDAAVVRTAGQIVLFGTGDTFDTGGRRMARIVVPWLRARGISRVDRLVMPHLRADHASGAAELAAALDIGQILVPRAWHGGPTNAQPCAEVSRWASGPATFEVTADCDMMLSVGPHRLAFGRRARFDTAQGGAIRFVVDGATGAVERRAQREGYPWPWRAPV
ncbi:MAG: DNA internalization-related competence protein ComEC/Rec2 [Steroidobacteraceae bacterium]